MFVQFNIPRPKAGQTMRNQDVRIYSEDQYEEYKRKFRFRGPKKADVFDPNYTCSTVDHTKTTKEFIMPVPKKNPNASKQHLKSRRTGR